jgi:hypothetical protein
MLYFILEFQDESLKNQQLLLERVSELENVVLRSMKNNSTSTSTATSWNWPMRTQEDLEEAEDWFKEKQLYQQEVF